MTFNIEDKIYFRWNAILYLIYYHISYITYFSFHTSRISRITVFVVRNFNKKDRGTI